MNYELVLFSVLQYYFIILSTHFVIVIGLHGIKCKKHINSKGMSNSKIISKKRPSFSRIVFLIIKKKIKLRKEMGKKMKTTATIVFFQKNTQHPMAAIS